MGMYWPRCAFFATPTEAQRERLKITDPDIVLGCEDRQGEGPLFFFVPVEGWQATRRLAVRAGRTASCRARPGQPDTRRRSR